MDVNFLLSKHIVGIPSFFALIIASQSGLFTTNIKITASSLHSIEALTKASKFVPFPEAKTPSFIGLLNLCNC